VRTLPQPQATVCWSNYERPAISLREVARRSGVPVGTVRDVQRRLREGQDPVPRPDRTTRAGRPATGSWQASTGAPTKATGTSQPSAAVRPRPPTSILAGLVQDPSLRYSEPGRAVVRRLQAHLINVEDRAEMADAVPAHCTYSIAELATCYARAWAQMADQAAARATPDQSRPAGAPRRK
jgi:hypothetical protein